MGGELNALPAPRRPRRAARTAARAGRARPAWCRARRRPRRRSRPRAGRAARRPDRWSNVRDAGGGARATTWLLKSSPGGRRIPSGSGTCHPRPSKVAGESDDGDLRRQQILDVEGEPVAHHHERPGTRCGRARPARPGRDGAACARAPAASSASGGCATSRVAAGDHLQRRHPPGVRVGEQLAPPVVRKVRVPEQRGDVLDRQGPVEVRDDDHRERRHQRGVVAGAELALRDAACDRRRQLAAGQQVVDAPADVALAQVAPGRPPGEERVVVRLAIAGDVVQAAFVRIRSNSARSSGRWPMARSSRCSAVDVDRRARDVEVAAEDDLRPDRPQPGRVGGHRLEKAHLGREVLAAVRDVDRRHQHAADVGRGDPRLVVELGVDEERTVGRQRPCARAAPRPSTPWCRASRTSIQGCRPPSWGCGRRRP